MIIDRLHNLVAPLSGYSDAVEEHRAVVDLLVLTVYCDHRISQEELDALDRFGDVHASWGSGAFSLEQYLSSAVAKVRSALGSPGGVDRIISEAAAAITTPALRAQTPEACAGVAALDGVDPSETEFVQRVRDALGVVGS